MDSNGSFSKDVRSSKTEPYISPLLRITKTMPIVNEQSPFQSPTILTPQQPPRVSTGDDSTMPYHMNLDPTLPLPVIVRVPTSGNPVSSHSFQDSFTAMSRNQQHVFSDERNFLTAPLSEYLNPTGHMQIMSMEPPSITSLLQGDHVAIVHAHLSTCRMTGHGPIFENPASGQLDSVVSSQPQISSFLAESLLPFRPSSALQLKQNASQYKDLCGIVTYADPNSFDNTSVFPPVSRELLLLMGGSSRAFDHTHDHMDSTAAVDVERAQQVHECKICHAKFSSSQAYGGHMSYHSKAKKEGKTDTSASTKSKSE
ncbi:hypothetical protein BS78_08G066000 [Paspalum vaginatum]|nr:hypothetical protein BS78_08G066000 [Paspalum vaginatum]